MRILLLIHGFNSLSQRVFVALKSAGHTVSIEFDINDGLTREAVELFQPDLILAPYLKRAIPSDIWQQHICLIVHPGIVGDRGPSALDWAILKDEALWGATVLQAVADMDAGPVWASHEFEMPSATKSSIYRRAVADAALIAIFEALEKFESGGSEVPLRPMLPSVKQSDRAIDWQKDSTETVVRKVRASDGVPGLRNGDFFLYDAYPTTLKGNVAGEVIATSGPAICFATIDGGVWVGHMRAVTGQHAFKLPATMLMRPDMLEIELDSAQGYQEISYREDGEIGYLRFNFYNGAMSTEQIERLQRAYAKASDRPVKVIVLEGGADFWSNGIHLNIIEAAPSAADESWRNINAMDDLAEMIIRTDSHLTVAAMGANAGAGGVFLARACDYVWIIETAILNPHYKDMGNLYGSEFWTYLLPRYCGTENAARIAEQRLPMSAQEAVSLGLADRAYCNNRADFDEHTQQYASALVLDYAELIDKKNQRRALDEAHKPLSEYRTEELQKMGRNFFGFDPSYHVARYNFVHKVCKSRTPVTLAKHRDKRNTERKAS